MLIRNLQFFLLVSQFGSAYSGARVSKTGLGLPLDFLLTNTRATPLDYKLLIILSLIFGAWMVGRL